MSQEPHGDARAPLLVIGADKAEARRITEILADFGYGVRFADAEAVASDIAASAPSVVLVDSASEDRGSDKELRDIPEQGTAPSVEEELLRSVRELQRRLEESETNREDALDEFERLKGELEDRVRRGTEELREVNRELRHQKELLLQSQEIAHVGSWEYVPSDDSLAWSEETYRIFGLTSDEFDGNYDAFFESVHPDDRRAVEDAYQSSVRDAESQYQIEHRIVRRDSGETRYVREKCRHVRDDSGAVVRSIGMVLDITEQVLAEESLRKSEERYRALYENAPLSYQSLDEDGCFLDVNPTWLKTLGYERDEVIGRRFSEFLHPDWKPHFEKNFPAFKKRGYVHDVQFRFVRKDGREVDVSFEGCIGYHPDGSFRQTYCVFKDITEWKKVEDEQRISLRMLQLLSEGSRLHDLMEDVSLVMRDWSGCEAVGIRLHQGEDFPYFETRGFPAEFVLAESSLCELDALGAPVRDAEGLTVLECMCGNVIRGRTDPALPFFTEYGSFWTNSTTDLLASTSEEGRPTDTRNRCHAEGYESLALVPIHHGTKTMGLLQFNDKRRGMFDEQRIAVFERLAANLALGLSQRIATESLRESETKYRHLIETCPDAVVVMNADGRISYANRPFAVLHGLDSPEDWYGRDSLDLVAPEDRPRAATDIKRVLDGETISDGEYVFLTVDGVPFPAVISAGAIQTHPHAPKSLLVIARDITERKRTEAALRESEARFREIFENMGAGVAIYDVVGDGEDFIFQDINPAGVQIGRKERESHIGRSVQDVYPGLVPMGLLDVFREVYRTGRPIHFPITAYKDDAISMWVENYVTKLPSGEIVSVYSDVTEHKQMEEEIREHRDHLERMVEKRTESLRAAMAELESAQESMIRMEKMAVLGRLSASVAHEVNNPLGAISAAGRMMEHSAERLGNVLRASISEQSSECTLVIDLLEMAAQTSETSWSTRERRERRDALVRELEDRGLENPRAIAEAFVDLGIWEERGRFLPILDRDDAAEVLQLARDLGAMLRGARIIDNATNRAAKIVFALKNYAHPGLGQLDKQVDVCQGIDNVLTLYRNKIEDKVDVVREYPADLPVIEAFSEELQQAWTNLIHNAIEAMDFRGTLTVRVATEPESITVEVADTGPGMPPDVRDRVFEPFFTTKRSGEGCGLGLDIVKRIVDHHHGDITVDSSEGVGTSIKVRLPRTQPLK